MRDSQLQGKGLLVVDDEPEIRKFLEFQFKRKGMSVLTAENGLAAIEVLKNNHQAIQVVISDLRMPEKTGLELLEHVRAQPESKHIPFILLTGQADQPQVARALRSGIDDILIKPMEFSDLVEKVKTVLAKPVAKS